MMRAGADTEEFLKNVSDKMLRHIINQITGNIESEGGYILTIIIFRDILLSASLDIMFVNILANYSHRQDGKGEKIEEYWHRGIVFCFNC